MLHLGMARELEKHQPFEKHDQYLFQNRQDEVCPFFNETVYLFLF